MAEIGRLRTRPASCSVRPLSLHSKLSSALLFSTTTISSRNTISHYPPNGPHERCNSGPFHICHSDLLLWYVLTSSSSCSSSSSSDFSAMCTENLSLHLLSPFDASFFGYRCRGDLGLDYQPAQGIPLRKFLFVLGY